MNLLFRGPRVPEPLHGAAGQVRGRGAAAAVVKTSIRRRRCEHQVGAAEGEGVGVGRSGWRAEGARGGEGEFRLGTLALELHGGGG